VAAGTVLLVKNIEIEHFVGASDFRIFPRSPRSVVAGAQHRREGNNNEPENA
jgi:hypothetical protein